LQSLVTRYNPNHHCKYKTFHKALCQIVPFDGLAQIVEISGERQVDLMIQRTHQSAPDPAYQDGKQYQDGQSNGNGNQTRKHQVMNGIDVHRSQRVDLLVDAHGANFSGHGRPDPAGD
jgi:hypothetical protein